MEGLKFSTQKEAGISDEAVYALFLEAFCQWTDHDLDAPFLHITFEEFKCIIHDAIVIVAVNTETGELLGARTLQLNVKKKYVHECFLSVSPKAKHTGIATRIIQYEEELVRKAGFHYLQCTTSADAVWSVNWHRKMGYQIIGYSRSAKRNHAALLFRKQLTPSLFWSGPLAPIIAKFRYLISYAITCLCRSSSGELNFLGKFAKKIIMRKR